MICVGAEEKRRRRTDQLGVGRGLVVPVRRADDEAVLESAGQPPVHSHAQVEIARDVDIDRLGLRKVGDLVVGQDVVITAELRDELTVPTGRESDDRAVRAVGPT